MERLRGVCDGDKVTLTLTRKRLTLLDNLRQFVMLKDLQEPFKASSGYTSAFFLLRCKGKEGGYMTIAANLASCRIGCTFFNARAFAKIKRAIAEAK